MDDALDHIWKALADPTRRRLLDLLRDEPRTTGALAAAFPALSRFAVMKHLGILEVAGLVVARKRGREVWHYLNAVPIRRIYERWVSAYQGQWATTLLGIQQVAERGRAAEMEVTHMETVQIEQEIPIAVTPERVFAALIEPDAWWSLRVPGGHGIVFEPHLGGRFIQRLDGVGAGMIWAVVTGFVPSKRLTLDGTWDMPGAVAARVTFDLEPHGNGTLLRLQHYAIGPIPEGARANFDTVWRDLLSNRLAAYAEHGVHYAPGEPA